MKEYAALIIDLKNSRRYSLEYRYDIQYYIRDVIEALNYVFRNSLERKVDFSAGDEVQGLFSSVEASYLYFRLFSMLVSPIEIRAGIGIGEWNIIVENAGTTAQDGYAYHNARYAIEATEDSLGYSILLFSDRYNDIIVNSLLNSTALIINKQSRYQNEMMLLSELLYPINAYDIIDTTKLEIIVNLMHSRNSITGRDRYHYVNYKNRPLFDRIDFFDINNFCHPIDAIYDSGSFFVVEGKIRGLSSQLAELIGVSRQSVEKTIKAANIYEARNLAVTTLKYLSSLGEFR